MAKPTETMKEKKPRARALKALIFRMPMAMGITVMAFSRMSTRLEIYIGHVWIVYKNLTDLKMM